MVSAVQKSYRKNILREMKGNASRMVSLFGIVALGVMMLTGLMSIAPSMRSAAQKYYVQQNVFDLRVLSTLGLSDQDIAAIAATPGVEAVMPVKTLDLEANWQGQEERIVVQLQALQQDPAADTDANMNRLVLRSGRMPQAANECVVHVMGYQAEITEGTVLTLPEDTEGTKHKEYTVVGLVQDPQHISTDKESSTVGNGQLNYIAYVLDGELTADYYTACYIKAENAGQYDNYSQEYQEAVDQVADRLEQISTAQCVQRREQLIDTANQKLAEARQTYDDQKAEAEQKFAEAEQQLDEGLQQLTDAEEQVSKIKKGEWYVLDRNSTLSFVTFEQYADRMDAIARVFPVFFFLVAALVATTTMTRMVDENRLQMGTLKALGYSNASIAGKYLFYALTASVLGSMAGMVVGFLVFPSIIWYAYQLIFSLPTFTLRFYPGMAAASVAISAAVIGLATWSACRSSLKEKSAALLLPRAPVAGKRIFLEYITPLWKRMSFSQKTTARNLFRYKKRFFMTVLGVAGCTALLLIGFGLQDSLLPIVTKQSTELSHNDLTVTLSDPAAFTVEKGLTDALEKGQVENWAAVYSKSVTIYNADGESAGVSVVGAQTDSQLSRYVTFRTRQGHKAIPFEKDSVVLTEKTALNLGVEPGDSIWVENPDGERVEMTLTGVTENYMFTRLYVSNAQLQTLLGTQDIPWNTVYAQTRCDSAADRNTMRETLLACNYVTGASFTEDATSMFDNLIVSLNSVVVLIIVCAAALAAVVLYNLISVNLAERKKELATIKVLGFYDKEVYRYIFREIDLLALMGSCVGLLLGIPLHQFIIRTVEMDQLMFIRTIAPHSYLLSVALTMLFTLAVCFVMRRHVKKISMVESMKAPE